MIELGKKATDKITGFTGIITARAQYLAGCDQYVLTPKMKPSDTNLSESQWFDEGRLEIEELGGITAEEVQAPERGGPQRDAPPS